MSERAKAIEECLDECTAIARSSSGSASTGAWSCVRALHKMLMDEPAKKKKNIHLGSSLDSLYAELGELEDVKKMTEERIARMDKEK